MKVWIRWPGFLAFILFTAVLAGGFYFFAGALVKAAIEYAGTEMIGAKVELDDADLTFSPLGVELHNLQVTSLDEPMLNALQVGRIKLNMSALEMLRRKVIIDDMDVEKVRLNTKRTTSGKIDEKPKEEPSLSAAKSYDFSMPTVELPDVKDILAKETLESERLVDAARLDMDKSEQKWEKKAAELPDKATFDAYERKLTLIKPVKTGNKLKDLKALSDAIDELKKVKKSLKSDLDQLSSAGKELRQDVSSMESNIEAALKAPSKDVALLKEKYSPSSSGVSNISRLLFGETVANWIGIALHWYRRLSPVLLSAMQTEKNEEERVLRHNGIDIKFKEHNPLPGFLVKSTRVSLELASGNLNGEIKDITSDQQVLGRPLTFLFDADKMKMIANVKFSGIFNHTNPSESIDTTALTLSGYQISDFVVSNSNSFPLALNSAVMDMKLNVELKQGALKANLLSQVKSANFAMSGDKNSGKFAKTIGESLKSVNEFNVKADLRGTLKDQDIDISSDLDNVIKNALGKQFKQRAQKFEMELKEGVEQKIKNLTAKLEFRQNKFNSIQQGLDIKKKNANEKLTLIDAKIDSLRKEKESEIDEKSEAAKDKLKDKFKDRFK